MTPQEFLQHLNILVQADNWEGVLEWYDTHYEAVRMLLSEDERDAVEGGAIHTATVVLEARRRRLQAEAATEPQLANAA